MVAHLTLCTYFDLFKAFSYIERILKSDFFLRKRPIFMGIRKSWNFFSYSYVGISLSFILEWFGWLNHGTYIRGYLKNRCARKDQLLLFSTFRHSIRLRAVTYRIFFSEKSNFPSRKRNMFWVTIWYRYHWLNYFLLNVWRLVLHRAQKKEVGIA